MVAATRHTWLVLAILTLLCASVLSLPLMKNAAAIREFGGMEVSACSPLDFYKRTPITTLTTLRLGEFVGEELYARIAGTTLPANPDRPPGTVSIVIFTPLRQKFLIELISEFKEQLGKLGLPPAHLHAYLSTDGADPGRSSAFADLLERQFGIIANTDVLQTTISPPESPYFLLAIIDHTGVVRYLSQTVTPCGVGEILTPLVAKDSGHD